jgi:hypothetical protein
MPDLKLGKLPDREPVKIAFKASPELARMLRDYAAAYREAYGEDEPIEQLVPFILTAFLESDRGFAKARKDKVSVEGPPGGGATSPPRQHRRSGSDNSTHNLE